MKPSRVVLGTAQLGLSYGIANRLGQPSETDAFKILAAAERLSVEGLDTAQDYGSSEQVIGNFLEGRSSSAMRIFTKLSGKTDVASADAIRASLASSAARLRAPIDVLFLHQPAHVSELSGTLGETLRTERDAGRIGKIGASIYTPAEFENCLSSDLIEAIQFPFNALDTRWVTEGWTQRAAESGKELFARSLMLQGLLTIPIGETQHKLPTAVPFLKRWYDVVEASGRTAPQMAVKIARALLPDVNLVMGCESVTQLEELSKLCSGEIQDFDIDWKSLQAPEIVTNPSLWRPASAS